jgi:hypothetical protein
VQPVSTRKWGRLVGDQLAPAENQPLEPGQTLTTPPGWPQTACRSDGHRSFGDLPGRPASRGAVHADRGPDKPRTNPLSRFEPYRAALQPDRRGLPVDTERRNTTLNHTYDQIARATT